MELTAREREAAATYIWWMTIELAKLAHDARFAELTYVLEMARLEASTVAGHAPPMERDDQQHADTPSLKRKS